MTVQEYRDYIAAGNPVVAGSDAHLFMHQMAQEAIRITMEINNKYHTPEELRKLFSNFGTLKCQSRSACSLPSIPIVERIPTLVSEYSSIAVASFRIKEASSSAMIALLVIMQHSVLSITIPIQSIVAT